MASEAPTGELSAAQKLMQKHAEAPHPVTVEDAPDEDLPVHAPAEASSSADAPSAKPAPKQAAPKTALDTQSHELFPELGAPKGKSANVAPIWGAKNANGKANGAASNGVSRSSTPASGAATPNKPSMFIPGRNVETVTLDAQYILPRGQLKRPIPDIIKDINRKSRATISMATSSNGRFKFDATGPQDVAQQALKDLVAQIGTRFAIKVPIPQSTRAHIIGKGGSMIKALQEKTGAKIQLPRVDENNPIDEEDDDATIDVTIEGNAISAASARDEILKIAGERSANVQTKVRGIPAAFYPFIAGRENTLAHTLEEDNGIQIRVPPLQAYVAGPSPVTANPGQQPVFAPAGHEENHIQLAGDRAAVQKVRAEIEQQVAELHRQLAAEQLSIQRGRHQFIIGDRGVPVEQFFSDTGCAILLPTDEDDDTITVIGPADQVSAGLEKAMDLAMGMQMSNLDIARFHRSAPGGAATHAGNVTRYLRQRKEIERLEKLYNTHINTPFSEGGALPWELYSREGKNAIRAQSEISGIINGQPPSRMSAVPVDPFFHQHLRNDVTRKVKQDFGVQLIVPEASESNIPVLLVYEGPDPADGPYQVPRSKPTDAEVRAFKEGLQDAQKHILDLINKQEAITTATLDVPAKFHERLRRFIKKEQESRSADQIPVRVTKVGTTVTLRGPASAVESLAAKANAFVEQEKEDEKERGFTLSFDFPQKFANHLIGKAGSNIRELRDRFDVEIQVQDGKVELKGPKAKAETARSHIQSLARTLADETTHTLKIDPKHHRELIGAQGTQINRLQTRYKVHIFFPRSAKNAADEQPNADAASDTGKPRRQQPADEVIIRGPKKGADEARDEIFSLYKYLEEHGATATVAVQQKQVGSLIGQGGAALDELRQATGARIDVPADRDTDIVEIQLKGTAAQVAKAKKILEEKRSVFDDTVVKTIEVEKKHHKALIGASGSNLREIVVKAGGSDDRRELARTIQFPKQEADGNTIKIEGRSDVVQKIVDRIQEIVGERESQVTEVVDVPIENHRSLIGRGGDTKRQLESKFTVSIDVPRQGDGKTGVKVTGRPENVDKAKEHILSLVQSQQGETIQVPRNLHHSVSNGGQFFRQLRNNHQVTVDHAGQPLPPKPDSSTRSNEGALPLITDDDDTAADAHSWKIVEIESGDDGDFPWVLRGTPENVEKAKEAIAKALEQAKKTDATGYLVLPDPRTYRHVIGPNGSKVNSIRKQSNCKIQVPRDQAKDEAIEIIGSKEGVELAKDLILDAVREGTNKSRDLQTRQARSILSIELDIGQMGSRLTPAKAPWEAVPPQEQLFVLITGANSTYGLILSGIGLSVGERLIDEFLSTRSLRSHLVLIPTTRSKSKSLQTIRSLRAYAARAAQTSTALPSRSGDAYRWEDTVARIHVLSLQVDLSDLRGVYAFAQELVRRPVSNPEGLEGEYLRHVRVPRLDTVVFNAAYGGWSGVNYPKAIWKFLTRGLVQSVTWPTYKQALPTCILNKRPEYNYPEKPLLGEVFTACVFGHYILARELLPLLSRRSTSETPGRIVWSSSLEATRNVFDKSDFQCFQGKGPYESAKRLTDVLSLTSNLPAALPYSDRFFTLDDPAEARAKPVPPRMYLTHPGVVASTLFPVPWFLMWAYELTLVISRFLGSPWHTVDSYSGSKSPVWIALQEQSALDEMKAERVKWGSSSNRHLEVGVKKTEVEGWGWEGKVENAAALEADTALGVFKKTIGRKRGMVDATKEDIVQFEELGAECWRT
ncbi:hypothetical protein FZEAL_9810, partial [Fusarium zealandicum]